MRTAFVFAGQGSQKVGMGADLYGEYPEYRRTFDDVDPDGHLRKLCFEGPQEELDQTSNTQPALVAFSVALDVLLEASGVKPDMVAGLSIGEYPALCAAGVFTPAQAVEIAAFRGKVMEEAVAGRESGMVAVLGLDRGPLEQACRDASTLGVVEPTNYNCPGQIVISGDKAAVDRAVELAMEAGAAKCIPLAVSGPFHTSLMAPAAEKIHAFFETVEFGQMRVPVVFGTTGLPLQEGQTVPGLLERQLKSSIHFEDIVRYMHGAGIGTIVEIGPDSTLSKLVRRTTREMEVVSIHDAGSFEKALGKLEEGSHDGR